MYSGGSWESFCCQLPEVPMSVTVTFCPFCLSSEAARLAPRMILVVMEPREPEVGRSMAIYVPCFGAGCSGVDGRGLNPGKEQPGRIMRVHMIRKTIRRRGETDILRTVMTLWVCPQP